jgi:hypothetical protein
MQFHIKKPVTQNDNKYYATKTMLFSPLIAWILSRRRASYDVGMRDVPTIVYI